MEISIITSDKDNSIELALNGDIDVSEALSLADRLLNFIPLINPKKVQINLANCPQVCNQAIAALVTFSLAPQLEGSTLHLLGLNQSLAERMRNLNLDRLFTLDA
jgi:ABC-type transporter Mla MlaB component